RDGNGSDDPGAPGARQQGGAGRSRLQGQCDRICGRALGGRGRSAQRRGRARPVRGAFNAGGAMRSLEYFPNLVSMFFTRAAEKGDAPFLWAKREGTWHPLSWRETAEQVATLAQALKDIGLARGDMVMLVSENRPEWCIADLAIMAAGCITVPAYTTNTERDHQHILDDSGARAVIASTATSAKPLLPAAIQSNCCEHVIGIEALPGGQSGSVSFHDWKTLMG